MTQDKKPECPNCTNQKLSVERRPDGNAKCLLCKWSGPYKDCFQTQDKKTKDEMKPQRIRPVEFWLNMRLERIYFDSDASCPDDEVHVIEYEAFKKLRDENEALRAALELINKEELNAQRPGGSYSRSAKISYDVLSKYPKENQ
jgi:hypothetical protein